MMLIIISNGCNKKFFLIEINKQHLIFSLKCISFFRVFVSCFFYFFFISLYINALWRKSFSIILLFIIYFCFRLICFHWMPVCECEWVFACECELCAAWIAKCFAISKHLVCRSVDFVCWQNCQRNCCGSISAERISTHCKYAVYLRCT